MHALGARAGARAALRLRCRHGQGRQPAEALGRAPGGVCKPASGDTGDRRAQHRVTRRLGGSAGCAPHGCPACLQTFLSTRWGKRPRCSVSAHRSWSFRVFSLCVVSRKLPTRVTVQDRKDPFQLRDTDSPPGSASSTPLPTAKHPEASRGRRRPRRQLRRTAPGGRPPPTTGRSRPQSRGLKGAAQRATRSRQRGRGVCRVKSDVLQGLDEIPGQRNNNFTCVQTKGAWVT